MPLSMNIWRSEGGSASAPTKACLIEEMSLPSSARLLDQDLQERRRADIARGPDRRDGVELQLGVADAARHDGAAQRPQRRFHHDAGRRQVIGEGVVDDVAGPEAAGMHGARAAEIVGLVGVDLEDRAGRHEDMAHLAHRHGDQPAHRRLLLLHLAQHRLAQHRQPGERRARGDGRPGRRPSATRRRTARCPWRGRSAAAGPASSAFSRSAGERVSSVS